MMMTLTAIIKDQYITGDDQYLANRKQNLWSNNKRRSKNTQADDLRRDEKVDFLLPSGRLSSSILMEDVTAFPLPFHEVTKEEYALSKRKQHQHADREQAHAVAESSTAFSVVQQCPVVPREKAPPYCFQKNKPSYLLPPNKGRETTHTTSSKELPFCRRRWVQLSRALSAPAAGHHEPAATAAVVCQHKDGASTTSSIQPATAPTSTLSPGLKQLPIDFSPGPWSVVVGRDKASLEAPGNKRLRVVIGWYLERYAKSHHNKEQKSQILAQIESTIRNGCEEHSGDSMNAAFVKFQDGRWWEVESSTIREKISRLLRETLHTKYTSSSRSKRERWRLKKNKGVPHKDNGNN